MSIGPGVLELATSILLLLNRTAVFGALLVAGLTGGALLSHILFIGVIVREDGGQLLR
jgi:hypothetical protein